MGDTRFVDALALASVAGVVGSLQATEPVSLLLGIGAPSATCALRYDARTRGFTELELERDADSPLCSGL